MIPAVYPMYARFEQPGVGDRKYHTAKRVLAWDDEGRALIASERGDALCRATDYSNFSHLSETDGTDGPAVALIPAGGWRVERTDDGKRWSQPLIGWALRADGSVVPMETDSQGLVLEVNDADYRIYHDDDREQAATEPDPVGRPVSPITA